MRYDDGTQTKAGKGHRQAGVWTGEEQRKRTDWPKHSTYEMPSSPAKVSFF